MQRETVLHCPTCKAVNSLGTQVMAGSLAQVPLKEWELSKICKGNTGVCALWVSARDHLTLWVHREASRTVLSIPQPPDRIQSTPGTIPWVNGAYRYSGEPLFCATDLPQTAL